ncbi:hypothetical protein [Paracoccus mutanolyticus]|uniref:hypothetical protein n=1 Tax=Paracoccus mutanolyticus TaxID=1499308 RepID=UPI0016721D1D|nr:hypothetical protein [Paracoccus mutanolyticus]
MSENTLAHELAEGGLVRGHYKPSWTNCGIALRTRAPLGDFFLVTAGCIGRLYVAFEVGLGIVDGRVMFQHAIAQQGAKDGGAPVDRMMALYGIVAKHWAAVTGSGRIRIGRRVWGLCYALRGQPEDP